MGILKVPDAPTLNRSEIDRPAPLNTVTASGIDFVPRTLKNTAAIVALGVFFLFAAKRYGLILPFVGGAALGAVLLVGMEWMIRRAFSADAILAKRGVKMRGDTPVSLEEKKKFGGKTAIVLFGLIKYPAVALLLWWLSKNATHLQLAAFISGFVLLQIVIGLRGLGAYLFPKTKNISLN